MKSVRTGQLALELQTLTIRQEAGEYEIFYDGLSLKKGTLDGKDYITDAMSIILENNQPQPSTTFRSLSHKTAAIFEDGKVMAMISAVDDIDSGALEAITAALNKVVRKRREHATEDVVALTDELKRNMRDK